MWIVVPNLNELKEQMDKRFPKRDKASDGSIGDTSHQASSSSHNADKTGSPEFRDGDSADEVRARDFDADTKDAVTAEMVVQHIIKHARAGTFWWVRYVIFNGRIWHKSDGYVTRKYTGSNKHTQHFHVNSDFTQKADTVKGTNWRLDDLGKPAAPKPSRPAQLVVDGKLGPTTIKRWQQVMGTAADGKISEKSSLVRAVQTRLKGTVDHRLVVDGDGNSLDTNTFRKTIAALQRYLKSPVDGVISTPVSEVVKALQRRLNTGKF
jgi:hypothetical protein